MAAEGGSDFYSQLKGTDFSNFSEATISRMITEARARQSKIEDELLPSVRKDIGIQKDNLAYHKNFMADKEGVCKKKALAKNRQKCLDESGPYQSSKVKVASANKNLKSLREQEKDLLAEQASIIEIIPELMVAQGTVSQTYADGWTDAENELAKQGTSHEGVREREAGLAAGYYEEVKSKAKMALEGGRVKTILLVIAGIAVIGLAGYFVFLKIKNRK